MTFDTRCVFGGGSEDRCCYVAVQNESHVVCPLRPTYPQAPAPTAPKENRPLSSLTHFPCFSEMAQLTDMMVNIGVEQGGKVSGMMSIMYL